MTAGGACFVAFGSTAAALGECDTSGVEPVAGDFESAISSAEALRGGNKAELVRGHVISIKIGCDKNSGTGADKPKEVV